MNEKLDAHPELWNEAVLKCVDNFKVYHQMMLDSVAKQVPVFFLRYEDLMSNSKQTLEQIFCFLLEVESVEGLNIQRRIDEVCNLGHSATVTYAQKVDVNKAKILFNRNISSYTTE